MEEAGRARRGYFVAGLGGAQFAVPGAEERLRALREPASEKADSEPLSLVLAATDPANPYGSTLPWPKKRIPAKDTPAGEEIAHDGIESRAQRAAGAQVVLHDGQLLAWFGRGEHNLHTFLPPDEPARTHAAHALAEALASLVDSGRRKALLIDRVDGEETAASDLAQALRAAGFTPGIKGFLKRVPLGYTAPEPETADAAAAESFADDDDA
jgi:ATP-dependent Lhr-like helicase